MLDENKEFQIKQAFSEFFVSIGRNDGWRICTPIIQLSSNVHSVPEFYMCSVTIQEQVMLDFVVIWYNEFQTPIVLMRPNSMYVLIRYNVDLAIDLHERQHPHY